jgi:hypothetical protein
LLELGIDKSGCCEDESRLDDKEGACDVGNGGFDVKLCGGIEGLIEFPVQRPRDTPNGPQGSIGAEDDGAGKGDDG